MKKDSIPHLAQPSFGIRLKKDMHRNWVLYLLFVPVVLFYVLFVYRPLFNIRVAFVDYNLFKGFAGSKPVGFKYFLKFINSPNFERVVRNTILLNVFSLIFSFPMPIIFALLVNELRNRHYKKLVQTVSYMPHFISVVVMAGLIRDFCSSTGLINQIIMFFGGKGTNLLNSAGLFRTIYIGSGVWQEVGWSSIIYLATLSNVDQEQYEAAYVDGANRFKQMIHITFPALVPLITLKFIMRVGSLLTTGYEKIILLYNPLTYETADVIASYIYRMGIGNNDYSYATAVGLFNSVINIFLVVTANMVSRRVSENSLW